MRHQKQPNKWSCLPTAFANLLNVDVQEIFDFLGHDGSEKVFEYGEKPERAFHIQEMLEFCIGRGYVIVPFEKAPVCSNRVETYTIPFPPSRVFKYLWAFDGVITGTTPRGLFHAVTWYGNVCYDPNGSQYTIDNFTIDTFYALVRLTSNEKLLF